MPNEVYVPSEAQLNLLIKACRETHERTLGKDVGERKDMARRLNKWDWEKNYGRKAFRCSRNNYSPPTTHIAHPDHPGEYITDVSEIHDQFGQNLGEGQLRPPQKQ